MNFVRGNDPKQSLGVGMYKKLSEKMMDSELEEYSINDFWEVWQWALEKKENTFFRWLVSFHNKKWKNKKIDISDFNNELLWRSIEVKNIEAVKCILSIPGLFVEEIFTKKQGVSNLKETFKRGDQTVNWKATNFGAFLQLSMHHYPCKEIENMLREYFHKYSKNELC